ncbi:DnaA: chromosomal replication initiator protein DnaA [Gaiella occulta]|uniref:Chromosomal replication initiator protein DnaA n=1 Tax=Gaiella occulta TaxID=1002870 RepID=A0A7M2YVB8_9ACTN|nr:chromosomal replication initiator protein DnaA [Gaiella occulta]RDI74082.1 DnaA: chromosomal replication initiator protein DnaA [Gaiella occulta]
MEHTAEPTAEHLWGDVSGRLREALNETTYTTWFGDASAGTLGDGVFSLVVPNDFTREWIEGHFLGFVKAAARDALGRDVRVLLTVREVEAVPGELVDHPATRTVVEPGTAPATATNPKYTFDLFVIGSSNRFAHAAALAVAEAPAQAYNPLFIYGGTGLGKTHLLQAIGQYVSEHSRGFTTRYVTSETFMNDFINSLRDKRIEGFKQRYRTYDVLLVDDIQFFEGKERIQEEFFHTFNSLYEAGRQIVISSDRPPKEIATLEERLRSRFEWGLITDIQPPDLETRIAILRKKVTTDRIDIRDPEVLTFIAGRVSTNIRELEGALTRVVAFSSLTGLSLTVELAEQVLRDLFPQGNPVPAVTIASIQEAVSDRFGMTVAELCSQKRSQSIAYPRQVAMYLSRELTDASLPKIGKEFGGRDHTTVIHATSKITRLISEDRSVYNLVQDLTARIKHSR